MFQLAEISRVINALVRLAVTGHKARTVNGEQHIQPLQVHIMNQLVVTALQKVE